MEWTHPAQIKTRTLNKCDMKVWAGLTWLRIENGTWKMEYEYREHIQHSHTLL